MGLLASSRRMKQARDLGDSLAHDNHYHHNVTGGRGRSKSRNARDRPVRLLRSRTLSTEIDGGRSPARLCNGSVVFRNRQGSGDVELRRLLGDTQPSLRWQEPLISLLQSYLIPQEARRALSFLMENMKTAYRAIKNPANSEGYPALFIDIQHKPTVFDINFWKKIMIALHFELTEPEGNRDLDLIEVVVTDYVTLEPLTGFMVLLQSLLNIDWDMLRMLLTLTSEEALHFLAVIQKVLEDNQPQDPQIVQDLHARYPDQLTALGFNLTKVKHKREVSWLPPSSDDIRHVEVALIGLHHDGRGLETYI